MNTTIDLAAEPYAFPLAPAALRAADHRHAARFPGARRLRRNARQRRLAIAPHHRAQPKTPGGVARRGSSGASYARRPSARPRRSAAGQENPRPQRDDHRRRRPDGPHSGARRSRPRHHSRALSRARRAGDRQAGQGRVPRHRPARHPAAPRRQAARRHRRDHGGLRQHHGARSQRPRLRLPRARRLRRLLFPGVPRHGPEDDQGAGRHLRLGVEFRRRDRGFGWVGTSAS